MEVIGYQIFIILTILAFHLFKREWVIWACVFWSLETIILLGYPPLIFIQLGVVWGTWLLLRKTSGQKEKIDELERIIAAKPADIQNIVRSLPKTDFKVLQGKEHLQFLEDAISSSDTHVVILSGWITKYVVTDEFIRLLESALKRGVNVYIGYGYRSTDTEHTEIKGSESQGIVQKLLSLKGKYRGEIYIGEFPTHEKILIKDSEFVVYGSNNWLANKSFKNLERSVVVYSSELAEKEFTRISKLIIKHKK